MHYALFVFVATAIFALLKNNFEKKKKKKKKMHDVFIIIFAMTFTTL